MLAVEGRELVISTRPPAFLLSTLSKHSFDLLTRELAHSSYYKLPKVSYSVSDFWSVG